MNKKANYNLPLPLLERMGKARELTGQNMSEFVRRALEEALKKINL